MAKKTIYMQITNDIYELPTAVADTMVELSKMTGMSPAAISNGVNLGVGMERNKKRFIKIEEDDDDS